MRCVCQKLMLCGIIRQVNSKITLTVALSLRAPYLRRAEGVARSQVGIFWNDNVSILACSHVFPSKHRVVPTTHANITWATSFVDN